jgi:ankyrin repeat protein
MLQDQYNIKKFKRNPEEIMEVECSTCLESFTSKCDISTTPCGHVFHTECMRKWLKNEKSCPQCRKPCTEQQMIKIYFSGSDERKRKLEKERVEKDKVNQAMHKWLFDNNPKKKNGYSLLHWAAVNGHINICKQILDKAYEKNPECDSDFLKCTPLHYASEKGHTEIAKMILEKIDNKNPKNVNGETPLHYAAKCGHLQICQMIIEVIDDTNPQDIKGFTPLHYAASHGHSEICEQILDNANEKRTECDCDMRQCTIHLCAAKKGHTEIAKVKEKNPKSIDGLIVLPQMVILKFVGR